MKTILISVGMKMFLAWLAATGWGIHSGCQYSLDIVPNTCWVARSYYSTGHTRTADYYSVTHAKFAWIGRVTFNEQIAEVR